MLVALRTWLFHPGRLHEFMARYGSEGLPALTRNGGALIGCYVSETGTLNEVVQLWRHDDAAAYERHGEALAGDPDWQRFCSFALPLVQRHGERLLKPAPLTTSA